MLRMGKLVEILGIALLGAGILFGQSSTKPGVIRGIAVLGPSKVLIPGAQIRLSNLEKTIDVKSLTNPRGEFSFEIAPGEYQLAGELIGFQISILGPIQVKEGETIRIELVLSPANTNTTIEVDIEKLPYKLL